MKKLFAIFFVLLLGYQFSYATTYETCDERTKFETTQAFCDLEGITRYQNFYCKSGVKFGYIKGYEGECWIYPQMTLQYQEKIYTSFEKVFLKVKNKNDDVKSNYARVISSYLQTNIWKESQKGKDAANLSKMAALHYLASLFDELGHFKFRAY